MKMKKKNHDSDSKGKQANPPAESPHRELVTIGRVKKPPVRRRRQDGYRENVACKNAQFMLVECFHSFNCN